MDIVARVGRRSTASQWGRGMAESWCESVLIPVKHGKLSERAGAGNTPPLYERGRLHGGNCASG